MASHSGNADPFTDLRNILLEGMRLGLLLRFWRTRKAILSGAAIWSSTFPSGRHSYMRPISFNCIEIGLVGIASKVLYWPISLFLKHSGLLAEAASSPPTIGQIVAIHSAGISEDAAILPATLKAAATVNSFALPFLIPTITFLSSGLIGVSSLWRFADSPKARREGQAAYLYLNGAYCLVPETGLSLLLLVAYAPLLPGAFDFLVVDILLLLVLLLFLVWELRLQLLRIPRVIFAHHGYVYRLFWPFRPLSIDNGPAEDYLITSLVYVTVLGVFLSILVDAIVMGICLLTASYSDPRAFGASP